MLAYTTISSSPMNAMSGSRISPFSFFTGKKHHYDLEQVEDIGGGSIERDAAFAELEKEKNLSFIKAWEDSEKTKAENKAQKHHQAITTWENSKKAALEADLKKIDEKLEKSKATYGEKMKNKIAWIRKQADEKRALVDAKKGEDFLKVEQMAAKYRATWQAPKPTFGCF